MPNKIRLTSNNVKLINKIQSNERRNAIQTYLFSSCAFENNNLKTVQHHPNGWDVALSELSVTGWQFGLGYLTIIGSLNMEASNQTGDYI